MLACSLFLVACKTNINNQSYPSVANDKYRDGGNEYLVKVLPEVDENYLRVHLGSNNFNIMMVRKVSTQWYMVVFDNDPGLSYLQKKVDKLDKLLVIQPNNRYQQMQRDLPDITPSLGRQPSS